jgi:predicted amidohydrolase YtcJ
MTLLVRDVEVDGVRADVRIDAGRITTITPQLTPAAREDVVDGGGGALVAGLADHHLHLLATAARAGSIDLSGSPSLEPLRTGGAGWLRAVGAEQELTRADLDAVVADRPVRVQHASGALWTVNGAGAEALGLDGTEGVTGQLWRADARLRALLGPDDAPDVRAVSDELLALGVTHCTDATPDLDGSTVELLHRSVSQHLLLLGDPRGAGPVKLVVRDDAPVDPEELAACIGGAHAAGRPVALHCVTRVGLVLATAALRRAGPYGGDRIEHAAVCDDEQADELRSLGVAVVTQPALAATRGDRYLRDVEPADRPWLWRCGGLEARGLGVALSSDAPYGPLDPWATIRAARDRTTQSGAVLGPGERIGAAHALRMLQGPLLDPAGPSRRVAVGAPADLVLLRVPLAAALADPDAGAVAVTILGGVPTPSGT